MQHVKVIIILLNLYLKYLDGMELKIMKGLFKTRCNVAKDTGATIDARKQKKTMMEKFVGNSNKAL